MDGLKFFVVFVEGLLSIFSPCILPILPVYLSMLSNSSPDEMENINFKSSVLIRNTIFFTLGISTTFFILGSSISAIGSSFNKYKDMIMLVGGFIIIFMGLFYVGIIKSNFLDREKRFNAPSRAMSWWTAFLLGLTFSFGWTPCIGPILSSVVIMASTSGSILISNLLILVYTIGFILPFIITSLFYSKLYSKFDKLKKHMGTIKKISGIIIIIAGCIMVITAFTNINRTSNRNNNIGKQQEQNNSTESGDSTDTKKDDNKKDTGENKIQSIDFTLYDQYGKTHKLSDYKGKIVFLNMWATWCPPCKRELPEIEEMHKEYTSDDDVVILSITAPNIGREGSKDDIKKFLSKEEYTFATLFDEDGSVLYQYGINSFPTTFIIDKEGNISQKVLGPMNREEMEKAINKAR